MRIVDQVSQWDGAPRTVPPRAIPSDLFPREMKRIDFSGLESPYPAAGTPKAKMAPSDPEFGGALENVTSSVRGKSESPYSAFFSFSLLGEKKPPEDKAPIQSIRRQENSP
ncbi:hypothetical protein [uncultured Rhodoblastus sp.]|uniref:hypothetical protein n=1 Tax=uncultured Rhodoblastus sp. TaxID=543037 RepID=UPI0025D56D45|nr:hypothetical protein [uncultured Rhodoblastus sp.]